METVCNVGYALNAKKLRKGGAEKSSDSSSKNGWCGGGLADILKVDSCSQGVSFRPFNSKTMNDHDFHVIIHKLTDWDSEESRSKLRDIENYVVEHPSTAIIDPLSSIKKITSRSRACECLRRVLDNERGESLSCDFDRPFMLPSYCVIEKKEDFQQQMDANNLHFPIICKPIHACGTPESHLMVVLVSCADINLIPSFPCLVQQYHNHDGNFYKVYVIGSDVMVHQRPSLPDLEGVLLGADEISRHIDRQQQNSQLPATDAEAVNKGNDSGRTMYGVRSVAFDSRHQYPTWDDFHFPIGMYPPTAATTSEDGVDTSAKSSTESKSRPISTPEPKPRKLSGEVDSAIVARCKAAAVIVQEVFGLSLFGFDVILPSRSPLEWQCNGTPPRSRPPSSSGAMGNPDALSHDSSSSSYSHSPDAVTDMTDAEVTSSSSSSTAHNVAGDVNGFSGSDILVIDVNFFPSYKEVSDFPVRLSALMREKAGLAPWKKVIATSNALIPVDI